MQRQGDILIMPIKDLPPDLRPAPDRVDARGEATGRAHVLDGVAELSLSQDMADLDAAFKGKVQK